ncbi:MAG: hypothetical protein QNJ45_19735 [Ardenticatenaceae bacterium]|nr:hypothetical protein [Ardenticatenaceae bacterium]
MSRQIYVPPGGPPQVERPSPEIYAAMGEENIFRMLADFYQLLSQSAIKSMFPRTEALLDEAAHKSGAFFVGLLGGPPLYHMQYGSPMLRGRHMPFPIDDSARTVWLDCFDQILADAPENYRFPPQHIAGFRNFLYAFSTWMVNTKE